MKRNSWKVVLSFLVVVCGPLAACGDESAGTASDDQSEDGASNDSIPEAVESVDDLTQRPTEIAITEPLDGSVPDEGTAAWLQCSSPDCEVLGPPLESALNEFGWRVNTINAGLTPEEVKDAWGIAARSDPDAVFATGFSRSIFDDQLKAIAGTGSPVLEGWVGDDARNGISAVSNGSSTSRAIGSAQADWVLAEEGSDSNILFIHSSSFATGQDVKAGFEQRLGKLCSDCSTEVIDVPAESFDQIPSKVVAELQADPDINYVVADEGSMLVGLPQAMNSASLDVPVVGQFPSETTAEYLADGSVVKAIVMPTMTDAMWKLVDSMARTFTGQSLDENTAASNLWVVTPEKADELEQPFHLVQDYEEQYRKLWDSGQ